MVQGRIVWTSGDLFKGKPKLDQNTRQRRVNKQGQEMTEYGFGLAVPKASLGEIWNKIHEAAYTIYPSRQIPPAFAWKYKDGDGIDHNGVSFAQREGHAGHLIFACVTTLPIKWYKYENGNNILINEGVKCGDYVNVQVQISAHAAQGTGKPGLYINPMAVQFLGFGKEIINAPSGDQIFGAADPSVQQGASAVPLAPQPGQMLVPNMAPQPHYAVLPPQMQPPQAAPAYPQQAPAPQAYPPPLATMQPPPFQPAPQAPTYPPQQQFAQPAPVGMPPIPR
jgi:hypothetical protein